MCVPPLPLVILVYVYLVLCLLDCVCGCVCDLLYLLVRGGCFLFVVCFWDAFCARDVFGVSWLVLLDLVCCWFWVGHSSAPI